MDKATFMQYVESEGVYMASLYANIQGVAIAVVQLWVRSK